MKAHDLGSVVIKEALSRAKLEPSAVNEVVMGQVNYFSLLILLINLIEILIRDYIFIHMYKNGEVWI